MATIVEEKIDLLIKLVDSTLKLIPVKELTDDLVRSFLSDVKEDSLIRNNFFNKLEVNKIVDFYNKDLITDQDLQDFFIDDFTSEIKIVEILRRLNFDQRKIILDKLILLDEEKYSKLDGKIDTKYGMINGVLIKDVSKKPKELNTEDQFYSLFEQENASMEIYKQFVDSVKRSKPQEIEVLIKDVLASNAALFKKDKGIESKEEFALVVKTAYLLMYNDQDHQDMIENIVIRIIKTLTFFEEPLAINTILNQLPQILIKDVLVRIDKGTRLKTFELRNEAIKIKKMIEKNSSEFINIKKCIEENNLTYIIINKE